MGPRYTRTLETEYGLLAVHYETNGDKTDVLVQLNNVLIHSIPAAWKKQTTSTIARKVCEAVKAGKIYIPNKEQK